MTRRCPGIVGAELVFPKYRCNTKLEPARRLIVYTRGSKDVAVEDVSSASNETGNVDKAMGAHLLYKPKSTRRRYSPKSTKPYRISTVSQSTSTTNRRDREGISHLISKTGDALFNRVLVISIVDVRAKAKSVGVRILWP